jgi:hypothetical protein
MKSLLIRFSGVLVVAVLALLFMFSGSFVSPPTADAATAPLQPGEFFGPGMRGLQALEQMFLALEATVSSFAQSFTSAHITTQDRCIADQSGAQTCITKPELDNLLAAQSSSPQVQISEPIVTISDASPTPPTSPPTDATTSAATSTSQ